MSDESPKRSPLWAMTLAVLAAWTGCGIYQWRVPPVIAARAVIQVPAATDVGTLCLRTDLRQSAQQQLEDDSAELSTSEPQPETPKLSGTLTARKIQNSGSQAVNPDINANDSKATSKQTSRRLTTEAWELTYQTQQPDRALQELSALMEVLEQRVTLAVHDSAADEPQENVALKLQALEEKRQSVHQVLADLTADTAATEDSAGSAISTESQQTLQQALVNARSDRMRAEEEWRLIDQEFNSHGQLDRALAKLSPGPVHEAVLLLDRQRKLSIELTRLNETEQRLGDIYGDKHPKLIEVRQKFEQLLSDLGGWAEIVHEQQIAERLQSSLESLVALKQQHEADLQLQLELGQSELSASEDQNQQRSKLMAQLAALDQELIEIQKSDASEASGRAPAFLRTEPPQVTNGPWYSNLGLLYGVATVCGLAAGRWIHRAWPTSEDFRDIRLERPSISTVLPKAETQLNLAERRAMRQSRLQRAYSG